MIDVNNQRETGSTFRVKLLLAGFLILGLLIITRLFFWQVIEAEELQNIANSQYRSRVNLPAKRGDILASDGFPLTTSSEAWLVWAYKPDLEETAPEIANKLAPILAEEPTVAPEALGAEDSQESETTASAKTRQELVDEERERLLGLLEKDSSWVPLAQKIDREKRDKIEALGLEGIGFDPQEKRIYPEASMAAHLLGFVGKDAAGQDKGYFGLEGYYDLTLRGVSGEVYREKDALGLPIISGIQQRIQPKNGMSLKTHLDRTIQFYLEKHLEDGLEKYGAKKGSAVVLRPQDGAVLAMASLPRYDPARFGEYQEKDFANPVVGESFEPGSIFKILIMSAALDAGVVEPDTKCDACSGPRKIAEYTIGTWNDKYYPDTTMTEVIQHSDNVGMIWVAEQLGKEKLYEYLEQFGIGKLTGIDLEDEQTPSLRPRDGWGLIDLAVASFGQGVAVTPLQMVRAAAAIANDGVLPVPQVVDKIIVDGWEQDIKPAFDGQVISKKAAQEMTRMMVNAVENGEAKWTKLPGFRIAGKTGTAQIPVAGHYDADKTIASFVGFAPVDKPKIVMLVTLHEPESSPWASETAAPLWFSIAKDIFPYLGIQPEF